MKPLALLLGLSAPLAAVFLQVDSRSATQVDSRSATQVDSRSATQEAPPAQPPSAAALQLEATLAAADIRLDLARGVVSLPCEVLVREDLLEYLLVRPNGASHESLLLTHTDPTLLNAALLALGLRSGTNATWTPVEPEPTREERSRGVSAYTITPPAGDGLHLSLGWREGDEVYFFRLEDLLSNLQDGRAMRRHAFVYLGSRFTTIERGEEVFAAAQYGNLINISFFHEGYTLLTAALPECVEQTIWTANAWLLPERGAPVELFLSREPLTSLPAAWSAALPRIDGAEHVESGR